MELEDAVFRARKGGALLFLGAGFSRGARTHCEGLRYEVPLAQEFSNYLMEKLGIPASYPLPIASKQFEKREGEHGLIKQLILAFSVTECFDHHKAIASIPWYRVYTTNYDNLFEFASEGARTWTPITTEEPPLSTKGKCVHINGHINNLNITTLKSQIKLTHTSYSTDSFAQSPWSSQLRADMSVASAIVFVGYSLFDIDISRIIFQSEELKEKTIFIGSPKDDLVMTEFFSEYGRLFPIGAEGFAERLQSTPDEDDQKLEHAFTWLEEYSVDNPVKPTDRDALDVIFLGDVRPECVAYSLSNPDVSYLIERLEVEETLSHIKNGNRWFLIHSNIGNGKTIFCHQLSVKLQSRGYKVYWDSEFELNRAYDIRAISNSSENIAVFIETDVSRFDVLRDLVSVGPNVVVIVTSRSAPYELGERAYLNVLPSNYIEMELNSLADDDLGKAVRLINGLGLWGESHDWKSDFDKEFFIKTECNRSVASLILEIVEHSDIGERIKQSAKALFERRDPVSDLAIASMFLARVGLDARLSTVSEILGQDAKQILRSERASAAKEFLRERNEKVVLRSAILGAFILREAARPELVASAAANFIMRIDKMNRTGGVLEKFYREIQRFPMIESMITGPRKQQVIIGFYESIKDLSGCRRHPLFRLHYAMARMTFNEWREADSYFSSARGLAKDGYGWATRDIDNHYARFLLESRTNSDIFADYMEAFERAHKILLDQMLKGNNREYPFRQAKGYVSFLNARGKSLSEEQLRTVKIACSRVKSAIENLDDGMKRRRDVIECDRAMDRAIELIDGGFSV